MAAEIARCRRVLGANGHHGQGGPPARSRMRASPATPAATPTANSPRSRAISGARPTPRRAPPRRCRDRRAAQGRPADRPAARTMADDRAHADEHELDRGSCAALDVAQASAATMATDGRMKDPPATTRPPHPARRYPMCMTSSVEVGPGMRLAAPTGRGRPRHPASGDARRARSAAGRRARPARRTRSGKPSERPGQLRQAARSRIRGRAGPPSQDRRPAPRWPWRPSPAAHHSGPGTPSSPPRCSGRRSRTATAGPRASRCARSRP